MKIQQSYKLHQKGKKEIHNILLQRMIRECEYISDRNGTLKQFSKRLASIQMEYRDEKCDMALIDNEGYKYLERLIREGK